MTFLPSKLPQLPRYTSYPTAPHFNAQSASDAQNILYSSITCDAPVSVYIHIPFCDRLCWFCGCHTKHTLKYEPVAAYVKTLIREIEQFSRRVSVRPKLNFLHFGGGSPSILRPAEARLIKEALNTTFEFTTDAETSVEVDPNDACESMMDALSILGMTRASLGVQDFNPIVQDAINRPQGFEETEALVDALRLIGVSSLNVDALYGLPFQTEQSILKTTQQVISLEPDRIALFGYAHVPSIKKHQNMIDAKALPTDDERIKQASASRTVIQEAGYETIGLDHFAKKYDSLARAKRDGKLRRNFQGYTTDQAKTLLGFGASSISSNQEVYVKNHVATNTYQRLISQGESVAGKGLVLSQDDQIRAFMIEALMCNFKLDGAELIERFGSVGTDYILEMEAAALADRYEICDFEQNVLKIRPNRHDFVRLIASRFDAYLNSGQSTYSKAV